MCGVYYERKAKSEGFSLIAGVDEAGCGPLAGPVVAAAVILKNKRFKNRIDDSKRLSSLQRQKAYEEILRNCFVGIGIIGHEVIDRLNILEASRLAMENAILNLRKKPQYILVDGNIDLEIPFKFKKIIKGDRKSKSIACASIVAKVTRDRIMYIYDRIWPDYEFLQHKGYGTKKHLERLKKFGPSPIHRKTFAPVKCLTQE